MLLARNFNVLFKSGNLTLSHHINKSATINLRRAIQTTCTLSAETKNQPSTGSENVRVYYGTLTPQIRAVKVFSLTTSLVGVAAQPVLYEQASKLGTSTPVIISICGFVGFFTFVTPFLIHMITSKYVTELHHNSNTNEYTASTISFFMTKKQITFKKEDVIVPEVPGMFTSFLVQSKTSKKQHALFVDPRLFDDANHYIKLMGYDKPIDFKLNSLEDQSDMSKK